MQTFRFVIQQNIPNTLTYKVISPTRNNFEAVNIVSRDDIWGAVGADILQEKVEAQNREAEEKAKKEAERAAARTAEEKRVKEAEEEEARRAAEEKQKLIDQQKEAERQAKEAEQQAQQAKEAGDYLETKFSDPNANVPGGYGGNPVKFLESNNYQKVNISNAPRGSNAEKLAIAAGENTTIYMKSDVRIDKFNDATIVAAATASDVATSIGVPLIITSGNEINKKHPKGCRHAEGQKLDVGTKYIGLTRAQRVAYADEIRTRLSTNQFYNYRVDIEDVGLDNEHIDIGVTGYKPAYSQVNPETYRQSVQNTGPFVPLSESTETFRRLNGYQPAPQAPTPTKQQKTQSKLDLYHQLNTQPR